MYGYQQAFLIQIIFLIQEILNRNLSFSTKEKFTSIYFVDKSNRKRSKFRVAYDFCFWEIYIFIRKTSNEKASNNFNFIRLPLKAFQRF